MNLLKNELITPPKVLIQNQHSPQRGLRQFWFSYSVELTNFWEYALDSCGLLVKVIPSPGKTVARGMWPQENGNIHWNHHRILEVFFHDTQILILSVTFTGCVAMKEKWRSHTWPTPWETPKLPPQGMLFHSPFNVQCIWTVVKMNWIAAGSKKWLLFVEKREK